MSEAQHDRVIARAARDALGPLGCFQRGRSRTWLDDHGWWVGVIEFQPSQFSKGSYLNVGACWLWASKDYLSFDEGYRIEDFQEFRDGAAFEGRADALAGRAKDEVIALRERFPSLDAAARRLRTKKMASDDIWGHYHAGMSAGLAGDMWTARDRLQSVVSVRERDVAWIAELKEATAGLLSVVDDAPRFQARAHGIIEGTRRLLKLAHWKR